jgi:glutathione S-transferase
MSDSMTLVHCPGSPSSRVVWMINELLDYDIDPNITVQFVDIYCGAIPTSKIMLNPRYGVPKLAIPNRESISNSIGIVMYLQEMYPNLSPSSRVRFYEYASVAQKRM